MPTATRPATTAQLRYLGTLADERRSLRDLPTVARAFRVLDDPAYTERREVSLLIDQLMAIRAPRTDGGRGALTARQDSGADDMPTPDGSTRAGRMLAAGSIEATATLDDGRHVTVTIRTRTRSGRGWTNAQLGQDGASTKIVVLGSVVGWINRHGDTYRVTFRTNRREYRAAIVAVLRYCAGATVFSDGVASVLEASRCGRCFRTLTDPVSIHRGIGPECFGRSTGSVHANAENASADRRAAARDTITGRAGDPTEQDAAAFAEALNDVSSAARTASRGLAVTASAAQTIQPSLTSLAAVAASPVLSGDQQRARDLISEALDGYCSAADRDFAMHIFDQLAAR